jgi:hypothetical protein
VPGTMVLETTWQTPTGWMTVQDFLAVGPVPGGTRRADYHRAPADSGAVGALVRIATCRVSGICAYFTGPAPGRRDEAGDERKTEMTSDDAMRASDRDRELAAGLLRDAYVAGRIDLDEFHDRTDGAYSARTWGELRDLTADLPTGQALAHAAPGTDPRTGVARFGGAPRRPFAFIWVMALIWLAIAGAAHAAAAIPLVLLSLFVLRAARWTMPPEPPLPCRAHPSGEHAVQTQAPWAPQTSDVCPMTRFSGRSAQVHQAANGQVGTQDQAV